MIPKIIHYCWISGDPNPKEIKRCLASWREVMPGYQIKCWSEENISLCNIPFVQEAIAVKQYPAAADYIRLYALFTEGGIYLDSDVEVLRPFDAFLENKFFSGTEAAVNNGKMGFNIEAAIMGAEPGHPFVRECMKYYEERHFVHEDGSFDNKYNIMPWVISSIAKGMYGYGYENREYQMKDGVTIYSTDYFTNNLCYDYFFSPDTYAVHRNAGSWMEMEHRGWLYHFCRKHNLMFYYKKIESLIAKI